MKKSFGPIECGYEIEVKGASPKWINQVHGGTIVPLTNSVPEADGIYTLEKHKPVHVFTADCTPLLFFSLEPNTPVIAVHSGWRGALNRIGQKALSFFGNSKAEVVVGPSILKCCFEVKEDLIETFQKEGHAIQPFLEKRDGKTYFDLVGFVIETQLKDVKVHREWSRCTYCSAPTLPSYRRNKSTDPQLRNWIVKNA